MKFKLKKSNQAKQEQLADAIRKGVPLAGLFAVSLLAGGCGEENANTSMGENPTPTSETRPALRGDIVPEPSSTSVQKNQKRELESSTMQLPGVPVRIQESQEAQAANVKNETPEFVTMGKVKVQ